MTMRNRYPSHRGAQLLAAVGTGVALAACTSMTVPSGADAVRVTIPAAWSPVRSAGVPDTLVDWWTRFGDAELDRLMGEALAAASDLRSAQARLRLARASRDLAQANLWPRLGVSGSATRSRTGREAGGDDTAQTRYGAGFDASWEMPIFGGLRDAVVAAATDVAAATASLEAVQVSLAAEIARNYIDLRAYQQRLRIARANVASQEETLQMTDWRKQAGLVSSLDVEQARSNLEQSRASIPSLENGRTAAENRLAILVGQVPGALHARLAIERPLPEAPAAIAVGIPADTLRQRPDVRAAELTLRAEIARTAERAADREPSLTLSGSFGWQTVDTLSFGSSSLVRSLAASLSANLFDGGRLRARFTAQDAVREQALVAYEKAILSALEDVENALAACAVGGERVAARRRAAEAARNAALLARAQYQAGLVDFQKVLDTERTLLTAEDGLATAESEVLTAMVSLYKALGGGWQPVMDETS